MINKIKYNYDGCCDVFRSNDCENCNFSEEDVNSEGFDEIIISSLFFRSFWLTVTFSKDLQMSEW